MAKQPPPRTAVMANAGSALVVAHLTVKRGDALALHDVTLDVRPLELHGLVGPNGAGKTTLLEAVAGLVPASGDVMLGGVPIEREQRRHHVFYVPHRGAPFHDERAGAVLRFTAAALGAAAALDDVVDRLELRACLGKRMRELDQSEHKRVLVATGLLVPHGFVLVDEPFDGLDHKETRALANVLRTSTNEKRALLVALQQPGQAERLCDRFTLLDHGRVVAAGQIHELKERARVHPGTPLEEVFVALA